MARLHVRCPCCEARLEVDDATGEVISHRAPQRQPAGGRDLDSLLAGIGEEKARAEALFEQERAAMADRERLLEEKFQEAMRRVEAEDDGERPARPFDFD